MSPMPSERPEIETPIAADVPEQRPIEIDYAWVDEQVALAPPLTAAQRDQLAMLLSGA